MGKGVMGGGQHGKLAIFPGWSIFCMYMVTQLQCAAHDRRLCSEIG